ncbi:MAG: hypothetical protein CL663_02905 [Bacteroidetes bacterium]|nr:hypothetical protein [Bacteroidota bacterium]
MSICYVYILRCSNGGLYTGSTRFLEYRIEQHNKGVGSWYTRRNRPVVLVYYERFPNIKLAFDMEHRIKGFNRRKKNILIKSRRNCLNQK